MNLGTLRRLVLLGNAVALAAAGWAAWDSLQEKPAPRDEKEWPRLFPVKKSESTDFASLGPGPRDGYAAAVSWPQGDKPVPKAETTTVEEKRPDPFQTTYKLAGLFFAEGPEVPPYNTFVLLNKAGADRSFAVQVGTRIPEEPTANLKNKVYTPWLLLGAELARDKEGPEGRRVLESPTRAKFVNVETNEEQVLTLEPGEIPVLSNPAAAATGPEIGTPAADGRLPPGQAMTARRLKYDLVQGVVEWEVAEQEIEWLGDYSDAEAKSVATVESRGPDGKPDGFVLKSIKPGSRADQYGFKPEDKIIAVNEEKVTSTADAVSKGKAQYETGRTTFQIKALRAGKEMNFTFHAPKKKGRAKP
jgi:hypothetical protein